MIFERDFCLFVTSFRACARYPPLGAGYGGLPKKDLDFIIPGVKTGYMPPSKWLHIYGNGKNAHVPL